MRKALRHGAFYMLLEAVLHHGMQFVEHQLEILLADDEVKLSERAQAEIRRKLGNIRWGIAVAEQAAQEVTHPDGRRPSAWLGRREGRK